MRALIALAFALAIALPASAVAQKNKVSRMIDGPTVRAPAGWVRFCEDYPQEHADCAAVTLRADQVRFAVLDEHLWKEVVRINLFVNRTIKDVEDIDQWPAAAERYTTRDKNGKIVKVDKWDFAESGKGDCEDKVLLKRKLLIEAGVPREALRIVSVMAKRADGKVTGHALLGIDTPTDTFFLDNLTNAIKKAENARFEAYLGRQSRTNPNIWVRFLRPEEMLARAN